MKLLFSMPIFFLAIPAGLIAQGASGPIDVDCRDPRQYTAEPFVEAAVVVDASTPAERLDRDLFGQVLPYVLMIRDWQSVEPKEVLVDSLAVLAPTSARMSGLKDDRASVLMMDNMLRMIDRVGIEKAVFPVSTDVDAVMERIDWARQLGVELDGWEIGNERYFCYNASRYVEIIRPIIRAIRGAFGHARIGAVGYLGHDTDWNLPVLEALGDSLDFLTIHAYSAAGDTATPLNPLYRASLREPGHHLRSIDELRHLVDREFPGRSIDLVMTEWNLGTFSGGGTYYLYPDHLTRCLMAAVHAGMFLTLMERSGAVSEAHLHEFTDPWTYGAVDTSGYRRATHIAFRMMADDLGAGRYPVDVACPTFDGEELAGSVSIPGAVVAPRGAQSMRVKIGRRGPYPANGSFRVDDVRVVPDGGWNLIENGGFEAGLAGWIVGGQPDTTVTVGLSAESPHSGDLCLGIDYLDSPTTSFYVHQDVPVVEGARYSLSAFVRSDSLRVTGLENLLENPGFEAGTFDPWKTTDQYPGSWLSIDTTMAHSGRYSARLDLASFGKNFWQLRQHVDTESGHMYSLRAHIRTEGLLPGGQEGCGAIIGAMIGLSIQGTGEYSPPLRGTSDWVERSVRYTSPGEELYARLSVQNAEYLLDGSAWVDDFEFVEDVRYLPSVFYEFLDGNGAVIDSGGFDLPERTVESRTPWRELSSGTIPVITVLATTDTLSDTLALLITNCDPENDIDLTLSIEGAAPVGDATLRTLGVAGCGLTDEEKLMESNDRGPLHPEYPDGYWRQNLSVTTRRVHIDGNPFSVVVPPHSLSTLKLRLLAPG